ncbi:MAG: hypothetical protein WBE47_00865 [Candidatus Acidiferrales bacterium]
MSRISRWFNRQFGTFDLLPQYFAAAAGAMQDVLWGALLPFVAWGIWFIVSNPPTWVNVTAVGIALFLAGYYVWRADHVRLMPKLGLNAPVIVDTTTNVAQLSRRFVQIPATCLTQTRLENCGGQLLRVWRWVDNDWQPTQVDEPLDLNWSILDVPTTFLERNVLRRLNVFFVENINRSVNFASNRIPLRMALSSMPLDVFKFDVRIAAQQGPPEYISFKVTFGQDWDSISLEKL